MTSAAQKELLDKLSTLRPGFPRAADDIDAVATRMSSGDYKGVLQAARLVLEVLLRDLIARVLSESPGKRTVDQLMQRIQKQQGDELVPVRVMAHMRTLQAWGNVGAHDHGGSLFEVPDKVASEDAINSLNSLVAVLNWYGDKHIEGGSPTAAAAGSVPEKVAPAQVTTPGKGRGLLFVVLGLGVVAAIVVILLVVSGGPSQRAMALRQQLDDVVRSWDDPAVPKTCRTQDENLLELLAPSATALKGGSPGSKRAEDKDALAKLQGVESAKPEAGEYWLLLAKARLFAGGDNSAVREAAETALARCDGLAAAQNILGTTYLKEGETAAARAAYEGAMRLADDYMAPRFNLALLDLQSGKVDKALATFDAFITLHPDNTGARMARARARLSKSNIDGAVEDLKAAVAAAPDDAAAHLMLGFALGKVGDAEGSMAAYCRAKELGHPKAAGLCKP